MSRITNEVRHLLDRYKVRTPPVRVEAIAEGEGLDVLFVNFKDNEAGIHGFYDAAERRIYVNASDTAEEKQFTIAHELGHHVLHRDHANSEGYVPRLVRSVDTTEEREADEFATRLLLPDAFAPTYFELFSDEEVKEVFVVTDATIGHARQLEIEE